MNDEAVCRTAPATPGLLKNVDNDNVYDNIRTLGENTFFQAMFTSGLIESEFERTR